MSAVWKKRSTSMSVDVDVDINEFEETALLQGLIDSGWLSEEEAEKIRFRAAQTNVSEPKNIRLGQMFPESDIQAATAELLGGRKKEALVLLERYLGGPWLGALTQWPAKNGLRPYVRP